MYKKQIVNVIGQGFVGGSLSTVLLEKGVIVNAFDKAGKFVEGVNKFSSLEDLIWQVDDNHHNDSDQFHTGITFLCLPTPMRKDGSVDLSIIESTLDKISKENTFIRKIIVIKSTIPPGSTQKWNDLYCKDNNMTIIFNPEFLREATAVEDMRNQNRIILGGPRPQINTVKQFYESVFPNVPIIKTSSTTAEMVKYVTNIHLAVKVSLANEFYQICNKLDEQGKNIDYDKVIEYATLDERLGKSHWKVPGPMPADDTGLPAMGFAGSCVIEGTLVQLNENETIKIEDLYQKFINGEELTLLSCNSQCNKLETKKVNKVTCKEYKGIVVEIVVDNKVIVTTPEHFHPLVNDTENFMTNSNENDVQIYFADDVILEDKLCVYKDNNLSFNKVLERENKIYIGKVYNVELETNDSENDDLFWIANNIVTHNCFIKDLNGLMHLAKELGIDPKTMSGAWEKNLEVRPQRDWEKLVGRAISSDNDNQDKEAPNDLTKEAIAESRTINEKQYDYDCWISYNGSKYYEGFVKSNTPQAAVTKYISDIGYENFENSETEICCQFVGSKYTLKFTVVVAENNKVIIKAKSLIID